MISWYLKGSRDQDAEISSFIEELDIKVQMSLSISSAEMSSILYLIPLLTSPLNPCDGLFRLFWSMGPVCSFSHNRKHILVVFYDIPGAPLTNQPRSPWSP